MKKKKISKKEIQPSNRILYIVPLSEKNKKEIQIDKVNLENDIIFFNAKQEKSNEIEGIKIYNQESLLSLLKMSDIKKIVIISFQFWQDNSEDYSSALKQLSEKTETHILSKSNLFGKASTIGWQISPDTLRELINQDILTEKYFWGRIKFYFHNLGLRYDYSELDYISPTRVKDKVGLGLSFLIKWYLKKPFSKSGMQRSGKSEPALFRGLFIVLSLVLLGLMPLMSRKAGISGDEEKHYKQAEYVYNYFATAGKDTTALNQPKTLLHYYGQSFDNLAYILEKWLKVENPYEFRHLLNSLTGWGAIVFAGLIAALLFGWRAGFITLILMFLSPRWLGHSLNNPVDIPFAFGCTMALYYVFKFNREFPHPSWKNALLIGVGLGIAIGIRIGGLLFLAFTVFYTGLNYLSKFGLKSLVQKNGRFILYRLILFIVPASIVGYLLGMVLWPYALQNPIKNPLLSLAAMTNISNSLRQVFEGKFIWSDYVPWYYSIKYILITVPVVIFAGILLSIGFLKRNVLNAGGVNLFALYFTIIFPVFWIIYKESNVYGGWRHLYFIYPPMVILAGTSFSYLIGVKLKWAKIVAWLVFAALLINPTIHILRSYPHHYIYYNEFIGGTKKANGKYEMDYYYNSLRATAEWIIENKLPKIKDDETIKVATNHFLLTRYYFRNYPQVKVSYIRYYDRGESDWDYATVANSFLSPYQLRKDIWPPSNTIHTIKVDGTPICAILERKNRYDLQAYRLVKNGQPQLAIPYFQKAIQADPKYESAYLDLAKLYLDIGDYNKAIAYGQQCLKYYKNFDNALYYIGLGYMNKQEYNYAIRYFKNVIKENLKYWSAYYYLGICYAQINNLNKALEYLDLCLQYNGSYKPAYYAIAQIFNMKGDKQNAQRYIKAAESIP